MHIDRANFIGVPIDRVPVTEILALLRQVSSRSPYKYLVTPNVDHVVRLSRGGQDSPQLNAAYRKAALSVCDSKVLATLARWKGISVPVVPGSDLTDELFKHVVCAGDRIAIVGGDQAVLACLANRHPGVEFVQHLPPMGLLQNPKARSAAASFIAEQRARFSFICVGSPQQELIAAEAAENPHARGLALCVGAALDFICGKQKRAPLAMRRLGLEWLHRLATNPRRLWRRYLLEGPRIFLLVLCWQRGPCPTVSHRDA